MQYDLVKYCMINGHLRSIEELKLIQKVENASIYEVIRVIDRVPLFLEDHLKRMRKTANLVGVNIER